MPNFHMVEKPDIRMWGFPFIFLSFFWPTNMASFSQSPLGQRGSRDVDSSPTSNNFYVWDVLFIFGYTYSYRLFLSFNNLIVWWRNTNYISYLLTWSNPVSVVLKPLTWELTFLDRILASKMSFQLFYRFKVDMWHLCYMETLN